MRDVLRAVDLDRSTERHSKDTPNMSTTLPPPPKVIREQVFAAAPIIGSDQKPVRMSYATVREVLCTDGATRYQIENRSGEKIYLDADALTNLGLVLQTFKA